MSARLANNHDSLLTLQCEAMLQLYEASFTAGGPQIASARSHLEVSACCSPVCSLACCQCRTVSTFCRNLHMLHRVALKIFMSGARHRSASDVELVYLSRITNRTATFMTSQPQARPLGTAHTQLTLTIKPTSPQKKWTQTVLHVHEETLPHSITIGPPVRQCPPKLLSTSLGRGRHVHSIPLVVRTTRGSA